MASQQDMQETEYALGISESRIGIGAGRCLAKQGIGPKGLRKAA